MRRWIPWAAVIISTIVICGLLGASVVQIIFPSSARVPTRTVAQATKTSKVAVTPGQTWTALPTLTARPPGQTPIPIPDDKNPYPLGKGKTLTLVLIKDESEPERVGTTITFTYVSSSTRGFVLIPGLWVIFPQVYVTLKGESSGKAIFEEIRCEATGAAQECGFWVFGQTAVLDELTVYYINEGKIRLGYYDRLWVPEEFVPKPTPPATPTPH